MKRYQILVPLLLLAFFLRVWRLPQTPPGLWYDEAYYSMDAAWLLDGGPWQLFFAGNNGREPIFIYLQTLLIWLFGAAPLTSRLVNPLVGVLTLPLMYVLARRLCRGTGWPAWVPYLATAGLAISFWHIGLSRGGYRGILLPFMASLTFYAFWRGWREGSLKWQLIAGLALGLSQYTYLAARALPLVLGVFGLGWTLLDRLGRGKGESQPAEPAASLKSLWSTLLLMALLSILVFAPLGWIFYQNPALFSSRTGDVTFSPDTPGKFLAHFSEAIRLFIDGGDPNWRHHLPGRPMLGWLGWLGFWPGLLLCLRRFRRPVYFFLLAALLVLYLPALLAVPPVHALRLSALLPIYYLIFALGLVRLAQWLSKPARSGSRTLSGFSRPVAAILMAVLVLEAALTTFDYFGRWARAEETYVEYNTPLVDFVNHITDLTQESAVIIPFQIYVHPTTRYLLHDHFTERIAPASLSGPAQLVTLPDNFRLLNVANIPELPAYAWLDHDAEGRGVVYISRPPRLEEQAYLRNEALRAKPKIYKDRFGRELAYFRWLPDPAPLLPMFTQPAPLREVNLVWGELAQLVGYEVTPEVVAPGQPVTLNLYWRSLTQLTFEHRLFLQILDRTGKPFNQWEGEAFREDMYRWRPQGILPTQHTLWLGPEMSPGPYLVRMGFFDEETGERLPLSASPLLNGDGTEAPIDQVQLGLFYVSEAGHAPRLPATPLSADFAGAIELIGVTLPAGLNPPPAGSQEGAVETPVGGLEVAFHWRALRPTEKPYTVFLQLLNDQGEVVSGWDSQPFNGLYPTSLWSPGEVIVDHFQLPLPADLPPAAYRLITGFYDYETGQRLPLATGGDFVEITSFNTFSP